MRSACYIWIFSCAVIGQKNRSRGMIPGLWLVNAATYIILHVTSAVFKQSKLTKLGRYAPMTALIIQISSIMWLPITAFLSKADMPSLNPPFRPLICGWNSAWHTSALSDYAECAGSPPLWFNIHLIVLSVEIWIFPDRIPTDYPGFVTGKMARHHYITLSGITPSCGSSHQPVNH